MKVRVRFGKVGLVRWTSHRDVARMWERALRRAEVPVSYTGGFSPRPQLSFGLALPTGCESVAEYLDIALDAPTDAAELAAVVDPHLPDGVDVLAAAVLEPGAPSLQEDVTSCAWDIAVPVGPDVLSEAVTRVLGAEELPVTRERKGRRQVEDLRPSVLALESMAGADGSGSRLLAELATRPRGVRPNELAEALGLELGPTRRICQWIERDGSRWEPLAAEAAGSVLAMGRAP